MRKKLAQVGVAVEARAPDPAESGEIVELAAEAEPILEAPIDLAKGDEEKSLAQAAYELMVIKKANPDVSFRAWAELTNALRAGYEERAASLQYDALFERCVRELTEKGEVNVAGAN